MPKLRGLFSACPKTGRIVGFKSTSPLLRWLFPVFGFIALLWYLIRVLPKPSRAMYPCQRIAAPLASGFVGYLLTFPVAVLACRKAHRHLRVARYWLAAFGFVAAVIAIVMSLRFSSDEAHAWIAAADPNQPIGQAYGIHPGRVVWVHAPEATRWPGPTAGEVFYPGSNIYWFATNNTDQATVARMMAQGLRELTGQQTVSGAWNAVFTHFNVTHHSQTNGYLPGEKIMIKLNFTTTFRGSCYTTPTPGRRVYDWMDGNSYVWNGAANSPQMVHALLSQLIYEVGIPQTNITVGDPCCLFANYLYEPLTNDFPNVRYLDLIGLSNRTAVAFSSVPFNWSGPPSDTTNQDWVPSSYASANYLINCAVLKTSSAGVTLCGKNHYGSLSRTPIDAGYYDLHQSLPYIVTGMGKYRAIVDLMGHPDIGGKTLICFLDALYAGRSWNGITQKWSLPPFGDGAGGSRSNWPSSIFMSEDPVAIDSVGYDFLAAEWPDDVLAANLQGGAEDYLHEAALADNPPSGTIYRPSGQRLSSLGVHEHWNNASDKQYSRNLGTGSGIELVYSYIPPTNFLMDGAVDSIGYRIATNGAMSLFAAVHGATLYVAARSAGTNGPNDHFVFVNEALSPLGPAPWSKSGQVAFDIFNKPYLGQKGTTNVISWSNGGASSTCAAAASTNGYMEGTIDLVQAFGTVPQTLYIAFAAYAVGNGGGLASACQVPAGNGNGTIESNEFIAVPTAVIGDEDLDGTLDSLDPTREFRVRNAAPTVGGFALNWPSIPAHIYRVYYTDDLTQEFQLLSGDLLAAQRQFSMAYTNNTTSTHRFYRIHLAP
ncbi:MAG TPA: DUF362 domain-containing protein [Verrucomicrobiae bacterium]|nr:DUF362 domain-containing protein [Verrucomicrobiae bacterium]